MQNYNQKIENICVLRTSSLGDICNMLPFIYTLRREYPKAKISWVIGKNEASFLEKIDGVEFITFDKSNTFKSYLSIAKRLTKIKYDIMFIMQVSLRANIISLFINSEIKLGYDSIRSSDLHSLFSNKKIQSSSHTHVVDVFLSFLNILNIEKNSLDFVHIDISNDGSVYEWAFEIFLLKLSPGGILILEGGTEERDSVEWMSKYNKPPIQAVIERFKETWNIQVVKDFPGLTIATKKV